GLAPDTTYFYRFRVGEIFSPVGTTKTLPEGAVDRVKLAVFSCSNYAAGYFHAYAEAAKRNDLDAVVHLGDYIYEYGRTTLDENGQTIPAYASEDAAQLGRQVEPAHEILSLADYRTRYAQYRGDEDLQALHAKLPFICVWDDHEVANDTWQDGAENHDPATEGSFATRQQAAIQAYAEWMPIRPVIQDGMLELARSFQWGDLVNLSMLDTRVIARSKQIDIKAFLPFSAEQQQAFMAAMADPTRTLLGKTQRDWLFEEFKKPATWHVLGQQILMGRMYLPAAVATQQMSVGDYAELGALAQLAQLAQLAGRAEAGDPTLTAAELQFLQANIQRLTPENLQFLQENVQRLTPEKMAQLRLPNIPYNLDAWDGYEVERRLVLAEAVKNKVKLVVLAGDTHNAWANQLGLPLMAEGSATNIDITDALAMANIGVEFATPSVSSPGLEEYLKLDTPQKVLEAEFGVPQLVGGLKYTNLSDRGFMLVTFDTEKVSAEWVFVSSIKQKTYGVMAERGKTLSASVMPANPDVPNCFGQLTFC
ncbi:MAG: alkaline phosphatase D family protein, partial [Pseudomonadota bacterium]|nr:alkaline phosphatase D family protein [Pseudomonadota bacterium]